MIPEREVIKILKEMKTYSIAQTQLLKQIYLEIKKLNKEVE